MPDHDGAQPGFRPSDRLDERLVVAKNRLLPGSVFVREEFERLEFAHGLRRCAVGFAPTAINGATDAGVDFGPRDALENFRAILGLCREKTSEGALRKEYRARKGGKAHSEEFRDFLLPLLHFFRDDFPLRRVGRRKTHELHRLAVGLHEPPAAAAEPTDALHLKDDARFALLFAARYEDALFLVFVRRHDAALGTRRHAEEREAHRVEDRCFAASRRPHDRKEAAPGVGGRSEVDFVGAPKRIDVLEAQFENLHGCLPQKSVAADRRVAHRFGKKGPQPFFFLFAARGFAKHLFKDGLGGEHFERQSLFRTEDVDRRIRQPEADEAQPQDRALVDERLEKVARGLRIR